MVPGKSQLSIATRVLSGSMIGPGSANASSSHRFVGLPKTTRPRDANNASSQSEIAAMRSNPAPRAVLIARRASADRSLLPASSQSQTWVSRSSGRGSEVFGIAAQFHVDRADDVAANPDRPGHAAKNVDRLLAQRHQLRHR